MRKGFTLVELLMVIAVISVLLGLIVPQAGRALRSARETTCQTNLKNLHAACMSFAADQSSGGDNAYLPRAGSYEYYVPQTKNYHGVKGWVSWLPRSGNPANTNAWPTWNNQKASQLPQLEEASVSKTLLAIRHGSLFEYTGKEMAAYRCPEASRKAGEDPALSYVMNEFFYSERNKSHRGRIMSWIGVRESFGGQTPEASRLLLFAEREGSRRNFPEEFGANCMLVCPEKNSKNNFHMLGAHHGTSGMKWGWVIFLDGHTEKVTPLTSDGDNRAWYLIRGLQPPKE